MPFATRHRRHPVEPLAHTRNGGGGGDDDGVGGTPL